MAMFIELLGVGVVAIPTGIISAGFVEQYSNIKKIYKISLIILGVIGTIGTLILALFFVYHQLTKQV